MPEKVRVGVVGTSWFTETFHIVPLKSHPGAEVSAVCGRREDYTQEIARKHGIHQVFTDYEAMIWHGNLDAVVVSSPDDLHHPITMTALEAGKHVLCEKPLALNAAQANEMAECAEAKGLVPGVPRNISKSCPSLTIPWTPSPAPTACSSTPSLRAGKPRRTSPTACGPWK